MLRKCMKDSFTASTLAWGEAVYWNKKNYRDGQMLLFVPVIL